MVQRDQGSVGRRSDPLAPSGGGTAGQEGTTLHRGTEATSETGRQAVEWAREETSRMAVEAKNRAWSALEGQKGNTAGEIHDFADALRQTARRLHEERHNTVAQYAERVADGLDSLSRSLREKNLETLIRDTEDFARRQPALFIGGAAAIGFVAARFLKASGEQPMGRSGRRMSESSGDTAGEWTAPSYYGTGSPAAAASGGTVGSETRRSDNIAGGGI